MSSYSLVTYHRGKFAPRYQSQLVSWFLDTYQRPRVSPISLLYLSGIYSPNMYVSLPGDGGELSTMIPPDSSSTHILAPLQTISFIV